jgi:hypothetical protein
MGSTLHDPGMERITLAVTVDKDAFWQTWHGSMTSAAGSSEAFRGGENSLREAHRRPHWRPETKCADRLHLLSLQ